MRLFECPACAATLYFRNSVCGACGQAVDYDPEADRMVASGAPCANRDAIGCNWRAGEGGPLCRACAMTTVIPDTFHGENRAHWGHAELAKRWVLAGLGRWGWFRAGDPGPRPAFELLAEATATGRVDVTMGHEAGVITLNVTEASPAELAARQEALGERLRTVVGHVRHEIAHFLFLRLQAAPGFAEAFRSRFGDERADYGAALGNHYAAGPPPGWQERYITGYASAHPHEDWAESVAHLLHLVDITDSAAAAGLLVQGLGAGDDAYAERDADRLVALGQRLGVAVNHVNRSMGLPDAYPFVLTPAIREKFGFVHARLSAGPPAAGWGGARDR